MSTRTFHALLALALLASAPSFAQDHDHVAATEAAPEKLGTVNFQTSCAPAVQPQFNRAVALLHSFQFARTITTLHEVLAADPSCSMAWWGIALSNWGNPFAAGIKPSAQLALGLEAVNQARALHPKTPRESAYIEAVAHLFTDPARLDRRARILAYEDAMAHLSAAYPADVEGSIFYALSLAAAADPEDKTYARQLQAGKILDALFVRYPDHPGLAHYIIHTYDVPPLAARAAAAAQQYSLIAPTSAHALHMPSHTFTRVGDWPASIATNLASAEAAKTAKDIGEQLHASDYLVYAYLQTAQDTAARQLVDSTAALFATFDPTHWTGGAASPAAAFFAHAAIPARYALERRDWAAAAQLEPLRSPFPNTDAITWFARGLGAAHLKDLPTARAAITSLEKCHDQLVAMHENYWANQVDIQRQEVLAWLAWAENKPQSALAALRVASQQEDQTEKSAITPGPLAPAREQLGELLLELHQPAEALQEFEATLTHEPNRFRTTCDAAHAASLSGDRPKARTYSQALLKLAAHADQPPRPEIAEAKAAKNAL